MVRNSVTTKLHGIKTAEADETRIPWWAPVGQNFRSLKSWNEEKVRNHRLVDIAYGDAEREDLSEFTLSDKRKMVVTADTFEEVATVSQRFNLVDNQRVVNVLMTVLEKENLDDVVWGEGRTYRDQFVVDLLFSTDELVAGSPTSDSEVHAYGISLKAANDKSSSVRITPCVYDSEQNSFIRGIGGGWKSVRHTKPEDEETVDMYDDMEYMFTETLLDLEGIAEEFKEKVARLANYEIDFDTQPFTHEGFFRQWLPSNASDKLIKAAVHRGQVRAGLISESTNETLEHPTIDMWSLVSGLTYAYSHEANMSDSSGLKSLHDRCSDALDDPEDVFTSVATEYYKENTDIDTESNQQNQIEQAATLRAEM